MSTPLSLVPKPQRADGAGASGGPLDLAVVADRIGWEEKTILAAARERGAALAEVAGFAAVPGRGVRGSADGHGLVLGTAAFLRESGIDVSALDAAALIRSVRSAAQAA